MDNDFTLDVEDILDDINSSEVVALYFPLFRKTLLLDTRRTALDGPMIKVVPMVGSMEERYRTLRRLRPRFRRPEELAVLAWPKYVRTLREVGVWDRLVQRYTVPGYEDKADDCEQAFEELKRLEKDEITQALRGRRYLTLWDRKGSRR